MHLSHHHWFLIYNLKDKQAWKILVVFFFAHFIWFTNMKYNVGWLGGSLGAWALLTGHPWPISFSSSVNLYSPEVLTMWIWQEPDCKSGCHYRVSFSFKLYQSLYWYFQKMAASFQSKMFRNQLTVSITYLITAHMKGSKLVKSVSMLKR